MKTIISILMLLAASTINGAEPWKFSAFSTEEKIRLQVDLYQESIEVPGMEMFGPMNGFMDGNLYGVWSITSFKIKNEKEAVINLSNDLGSETQKVTLSQTSDSTYTARLEDGVVMKKVVGRKLVKIPGVIIFKKNT